MSGWSLPRFSTYTSSATANPPLPSAVPTTTSTAIQMPQG